MKRVVEKNRSKKRAEIKYDVHDNREQTGNKQGTNHYWYTENTKAEHRKRSAAVNLGTAVT